MRIVVNDIAASVGGAMTVLRDFYACVCEYGKEHEWIFLLNDRYFDERENVQIIVLDEIKKNPIKKVLFDFFTGKQFIEKLKPDVVFSMQNIITFGVKVPQVVYVHQSLPFQHIKKFSLFKAEAVSYTHLDVYKRQWYGDNCLIWRNISRRRKQSICATRKD